MILTTPLFSELKKLFPESELFVLASKVNNEIALSDKNISGTIVYKKDFLSVLSLISTLKKIRFDYWIDTKDEYSSTSKTLLKFGKYSESLGFNTKEKLFDTSLKKFVKGEHAIDINLSPLYYFNKDFKQTVNRPSISIPAETEKKYSELFVRIQKKKILVNISAGAENRYWKMNKWLELMQKIESDLQILLISDKKDKPLANDIIKNYKEKNLTYINAGNIFEVAEVVKCSDVVISPDTSIVHLASCFNKPIVAMFHNVDWVIKRYAPLSDVNRVILSKHKNSISDISMETVLEKLKEIIG
jgi:ADP-heptose:LPS heptosyltransferase